MLDLQPRLTSDNFLLRPLVADDFEALFAAASHPEIWAGHPATDRFKPEVFAPYFNMLLTQGGTLIIVDRKKDRIIGCSRYYYPPQSSEQLSIGFTFMECEYWGGATNYAVKKMMLDHAFNEVNDVWFHIGPDNIRSQKATLKLGARYERTETANLAGGPTSWKYYRLQKSVWKNPT